MVECLPSAHEDLGWIPSTEFQLMRLETGELEVQGCLWPNRELEVNLGNIACLKEMGRATQSYDFIIVLYLLLAPDNL